MLLCLLSFFFFFFLYLFFVFFFIFLFVTCYFFFFFQAEDGIRDGRVTGVQTCALPIWRAGVRPRVNRGGLYPFARAGTTVIARDLVVSSIIEDMLAGRPVVYADFLGYDEVAHHTGIERFDALAVIRAIDQQIGRLHRAAQLGPRRYRLIVLSDHGVTQGWAFTDRFGESIQELVGRLCGGDPPRRRRTRAAHRPPDTGWQVGAALASAGGPIARRL